ncbi:hypothetical protein NSU06_01310 [Staphylococcus sp. FSL W8-1270]|uniref:hypothetical protein n=1 Tax=Staphylococcus sp. FSL W8-1270 TaxID=2954652 RepID=UPI0030F9B5D3
MEEAISFEKFLDLNYLTEDSLFKIKNVNESTNKLLEEYKEIAINQVIQNFGLDKILNIYKDGGNVTTVHNAEKGIYTNKKVKEKFDDLKQYNRSDYSNNIYSYDEKGNKILEVMGLNSLRNQTNLKIKEKHNPIANTIKIKNENRTNSQKSHSRYKTSENYKEQISNFLNDSFNEDGKLFDRYNSANSYENAKELHIDHIVSAKSIHYRTDLTLFMSKEEKQLLALNPNNLAFTKGPANQSKGEHDLLVWANSKSKKNPNKTNAEYFNLDINDMNKLHQTAVKTINEKAKIARRKYYTKETFKGSTKQGIQVGMKEMLGMLLYDLQNEFFKEMKYYFNNFKNFHKNKVKWQELTLCFSRIKDKVFNRAKSYFVGFSTGFISGFLGNILTVIINTFKTTYKRLAKLIGETFNGVVKSVKLLLTAENDETKYKEAVKVFTATVIGALGGIMTESLITYLRTTPFSIFAELIGATVGGILTGMTVATTMYMIDDFKGFIDSLKGIFKKDEYSQEELKAKFEELLNKIDEEYTIILKRIRREYLKLNEITLKAFDMKISANERLTNTAIYASTMNVKENEIVEDLEDIDDFFFN